MTLPVKHYIAGPMAGYAENNYPFFIASERYLRSVGFLTVNPATAGLENPNGTTFTWEQCMKIDIRLLLNCSGIVLLPGWKKSRGATLEALIAVLLGYTVNFLLHTEEGGFQLVSGKGYSIGGVLANFVKAHKLTHMLVGK